VGHPAREDHARQSGHGHARDVPSPLGKSVVVVAVNGVEAKVLRWRHDNVCRSPIYGLDWTATHIPKNTFH
jgi:hypothetical protein